MSDASRPLGKTVETGLRGEDGGGRWLSRTEMGDQRDQVNSDRETESPEMGDGHQSGAQSLGSQSKAPTGGNERQEADKRGGVPASKFGNGGTPLSGWGSPRDDEVRGMPSHLKNTLDAKLGKAMGKSADIPRVLEPIRTHIGYFVARSEAWVAPMHTHTTTPLSASPRLGWGPLSPPWWCVSVLSYTHTSGLDVHRHKDVQQG
jgi:hypothetical protein